MGSFECTNRCRRVVVGLKPVEIPYPPNTLCSSSENPLMYEITSGLLFLYLFCILLSFFPHLHQHPFGVSIINRALLAFSNSFFLSPKLLTIDFALWVRILASPRVCSKGWLLSKFKYWSEWVSFLNTLVWIVFINHWQNVLKSPSISTQTTPTTLSRWTTQRACPLSQNGSREE